MQVFIEDDHYIWHEGKEILTNNVSKLLDFSCRGSFTGERCEKDTSLQQEKENVTVAVETHDVSFELATTNNAVFAALITLSVTCIILIIAVIYLSFRLRSLSQSKSSRLKRRIIKQEKNHQLGERGIDIEECCNMNICETVIEYDTPSCASVSILSFN